MHTGRQSQSAWVHISMTASTLLLLLLLLAGCVQQVAAIDANSSQSTQAYVLNKDMRLLWRVLGDEIVYTVECNHASWVGFGLHSVGSSNSAMTNADFMVAEFDDNTGTLVRVHDMFAVARDEGFHTPQDDTTMGGEYNILESFGFQDKKQGFSTFTVRRKLKTNDTKTDHPITPGDQRIIFAHGNPLSATPNKFAFHGPNNAGEGVINFFTGASVGPSFDYKSLHGALMTLGFSVCMMFGAFVSRYLKAHPWWFPLHVSMQVAGTIIVLAGATIMMINVVGLHFTSVHSVLGLITLGLTLVTATLGVTADRKYDESRLFVPMWPDRLHWYAARLVLVLSTGTIVMGMLLLEVPTGVLIVYGLYIGLLILQALQLEWRKNKESDRGVMYASLGK